MKKEAIFSKGEKLIYTLGRFWNDAKDIVLFIMLNPSNVDSMSNEPTINRLISFSKILRFGSSYFLNITLDQINKKGLHLSEGLFYTNKLVLNLFFCLIIKVTLYRNHQMIVSSSLKHNVGSTRIKISRVSF